MTDCFFEYFEKINEIVKVLEKYYKESFRAFFSINNTLIIHNLFLNFNKIIFYYL